MRESINTQVAHGNDVGRGSGAALSSSEHFLKGRVVVRKNNTNAKSSKDEESSETEVDGLEGVLDVDAWALGLARDHGDVLRTDNAERGSLKGTEECLEAAKIASGVDSTEWARITPRTEGVRILLGVATAHLTVLSIVLFL